MEGIKDFFFGAGRLWVAVAQVGAAGAMPGRGFRDLVDWLRLDIATAAGPQELWWMICRAWSWGVRCLVRWRRR
jgi:hypothetical protein